MAETNRTARRRALGMLRLGRKPASRSAHRPILEPKDQGELLRGWFLHVHKARDRHNEVARTLESRRNRVAIPAVALAALSGSGVIASTGTDWPAEAIVAVGLLGVLGAVLAAVNTSLDYAGRAAVHHATAARYKSIIRELEQLLTGPARPAVADDVLTNLRRRLDELEEAAPVVGRGESALVDRRYDPAYRIGSVLLDLMDDGEQAAEPASPPAPRPVPLSAES